MKKYTTVLGRYSRKEPVEVRTDCLNSSISVPEYSDFLELVWASEKRLKGGAVSDTAIEVVPPIAAVVVNSDY